MTAILLLAASLAQPPEPGTVIPLWDRKAPHAVGDSNSDKPSVKVFPVPADKSSGAAVVICPGGGYGFLADDHEGKQVAEYFNKLGVTAFVLKYRIVQKDRPGPLMYAPLADVNRAIRLARSKAKEYGYEPTKVGLMGFSAGGHLASTGGTHFDDGLLKDGDEIDKVSSRPDFLILGYPVISMENGIAHGGTRTNLIGKEPDAKLVEEFSNEKHVTAKTPPTFIFHTNEDKAVLAENPVRFYLALRKAGVPAEMHIYEKGHHGLGLGNDPKWTKGNTYTASWPDHLTEWLKVRGVVKK